jgi:lysophospholipid acyltransferase (LPLAT)-like uncharacterized protein
VTEPRDQLFQFAPLNEYSLKQRITIRLADAAFYLFINIIGATIRFEVQGAENLDAVKEAGKLPIICFWHDRIFLGTYFFRDQGIVVLTSKSFDGEYIARFIQRFGFGAIRGSSSRGGAAALIEMIRSMRDGHAMAFSIDGPRGPRYEAKPGAVLLAKKTGNALLPFIVQPQRYWQLKSWDKMQIPVPFTKALAVIGEPIYVGADASDDEVAERLKELQDVLDQLTDEGRRWSGGK